MYNLAYYYIYLLVKKKNADPNFYAAGIVFLTILIHVSFIFKIVQVAVEFNGFKQVGGSYLTNKLFIMPILIIPLVIVHKYYLYTFPQLEAKYKKTQLINLSNTVLVFGQLIIPLLAAILLSIK